MKMRFSTWNLCLYRACLLITILKEPSRYVRFNGNTGGHMGQRWHQSNGEYVFFFGKGNKNHELGTGLFYVNKRIITSVKMVEFVRDGIVHSTKRLLVF
jgi:hypothetical protein